MKSVGAIGTVAAVLALAGPASAATTWTVRVGADGCGGGDTDCGSIAQANGAAADNDTVAIEPKSDGWSENVTFAQQGIKLQGQGAGDVRVLGTLTFTGAGTFSISASSSWRRARPR